MILCVRLTYLDYGSDKIPPLAKICTMTATTTPSSGKILFSNSPHIPKRDDLSHKGGVPIDDRGTTHGPPTNKGEIGPLQKQVDTHTLVASQNVIDTSK